jgi:hypothetical protein
MTSNCASNNAKDGQKWNTNDTSNDKNSVIAPAIAFYPPYHTSNDHQQNNDQSRLAQLRHTITGPICTTNDRGITGILVPCGETEIEHDGAEEVHDSPTRASVPTPPSSTFLASTSSGYPTQQPLYPTHYSSRATPNTSAKRR